MDFVRWGAMSPQKHKEARRPEISTTSMFHVAPTVWGIYAFPRGFVFDWLLGMSESDMHYIAAPEGCRDIRAQMEVFIEKV